MGEITIPGVRVSEQVIQNGIPITTLRPLGNELPHELVVIYGGSTDKNFRQVVREKWGEELARRGFTVHCFDFRSNLPGEDFYKFGLWNRLWDASLAVNWLLSSAQKKYPLTLVGVSMGGHLAVHLSEELGDRLANLILVAPAAYHHDALRPGLKFSSKPKEGEEPGEFTKILLRPHGWKESKIFETAKNIQARSLIIHFFGDKVVNDIPLRYWDVICLNHSKSRRNTVAVGYPGGHGGTFTDPARIKFILDEIAGFLTGPSQ